jgi:hypothetical protein
LLVTDLPEDSKRGDGKSKVAHLTPGATLTVEGHFAKASPAGFASSDGLLVYHSSEVTTK